MNPLSNKNKARDDFEKAKRKHFWEHLLRQLTHLSNDLVDYEALHDHIHIQAQHDRGVKTIPIAKIVGSVGRHDKFSRAFMPVDETTRDRWEHVDEAMLEGHDLPAIEVYQIGDLYFVVDGNHRVSVCRMQGVEYIDAHVIEIETEETIRTTIEARAIIKDEQDD